MKRLLTAALVAGLLAFPVLAEKEIPVNIKADTLKYSEETGMITATGSVEIYFEDIKINSDELVMNTKTNIVTAEGNITMSSQDFDGTGSALTYNVNDETSSFADFKTKMSPSTIQGNIYLRSENIDKLTNKWDGRQGLMSTCDYAADDHEHYKVAARRVEYYPDDKIVGYSVTFYIGRVPVLWAPYLVYDLKRKRKRNWSIGHNEVEGDFIKTFWDYPGGVLFLDEMEKKGFGKGFESPYDLKKWGAGTLYLYNIVEPTSVTDWVYKLNHSLKVTQESTLSLSHQYHSIYQVPAGRLEQTQYGLSFSHLKDTRRFNSALSLLDNRGGNLERLNYTLSNYMDQLDTSYYLNWDSGKTEPRYVISSQRLSHRQPFLFNSNLNFNTAYSNYIRTVGQAGDEKLEVNYTLTQTGTFYTVSIYENWYMDVDRGLYTNDESDQYLEKRPEITLSLRPYDLRLFKLTPTFGYGYYNEIRYVDALGRNRKFESGRYSTTLNADQNFNLPLGSVLTFGYGVDQFLYDPGDQLYNMRENISLNSTFTSWFRNNIAFNRGLSEGNTPFFFDRLGNKYSYIRDTINLNYLSYLSWMLTGGFNYETKQHFNYETTLSLTPNPAMSSNLRTGYDIENRKWLDLMVSARYNPHPQLNENATMIQDLNTGTIRSLNNSLEFELFDEENWPNHWKFKLGHVYNPSTKQMKLMDVMITKDLHCWEVKYLYSDYRKEMSMIFTLKALPGEPFGYAPGRGFYFDSFEKALKEETGSGASPQRY